VLRGNATKFEDGEGRLHGRPEIGGLSPLMPRRSEMGMGSVDLAIVNRLRYENHLPLNGAVIEIGAQQLSNEFLASIDRHKEAFALFQSQKPIALPSPTESDLLPADAPYSRALWESLGYRYASIDIDGSPDVIPLDLNYDRVPLRHRRKYDLVTNFGTTEHVANQLNAFKIIHDLAKVGGIMLHSLPAQGYPTHGLINYNLKFFWMLSRSNNYKWHYMDFEADGIGKPLPSDIFIALKQYPGSHAPLESFILSDCAIRVALERTSPMKFIPPLDVNTGTKTPNRRLKKRYPTVFLL
jgi:hypothetical protein